MLPSIVLDGAFGVLDQCGIARAMRYSHGLLQCGQLLVQLTCFCQETDSGLGMPNLLSARAHSHSQEPDQRDESDQRQPWPPMLAIGLRCEMSFQDDCGRQAQ